MDAPVKVGIFTKQPGERISNSILYNDALDVDDYLETVDSCIATPPGLSVNAGLANGSRVKVWHEGGTDGVSYTVTVKVTTHSGERFEDEIICKVKEVSR